MSIVYPLSLPTSIGIESIELRAVNAVATSQSPFTYKQQIVSHQGQRWEASVSVASNIRRDLAAPWKAFLTALKGQTGTFLLGDPDYATPQGVVSGDTVLADNGAVTGANVSGESTIHVDGFTANTDNLLLPGDYIQLGSGATATLHQVLTAVDSDTGGAATIDIWPHLRRDLTDNEAVTYTAPKGLFRLSSNVSSWSINNSSAYGISFEAVEAL
jgi:hypothetical protein